MPIPATGSPIEEQLKNWLKPSFSPSSKADNVTVQKFNELMYSHNQSINSQTSAASKVEASMQLPSPLSMLNNFSINYHKDTHFLHQSVYEFWKKNQDGDHILKTENVLDAQKKLQNITFQMSLFAKIIGSIVSGINQVLRIQ